MKDIDSFVSNFALWWDRRLGKKRSKKKFLSALRRAVFEELPRRDDSFEIQIRDIPGSEGLIFSLSSENLSIIPFKKKALITSITGPDWGRGWKDISSDKDVAEEIDFFFHFASQYIFRSRLAPILGAISIIFNRNCDFRGDMFASIRGQDGQEDSRIDQFFSGIFNRYGEQLSVAKGNKRTKQLKIWINETNAWTPLSIDAFFSYCELSI